jgi:SAM-dependent methyltransferase
MLKGLKDIMRAMVNAAGYNLVPRGHMTYDPNVHGTYDLRKNIVVPSGQAVYDPNVYGRYDLASQRVVSKSYVVGPELSSYDVLMAEAQRYARGMPVKLETDRYKLAISLLDSGQGICLDACTPQPLDWVRQRVAELGYDYVPIDVNGDGTSVKQENLIRLSFADGSISRILSLDTLEHIEDYKKALSELYRVLGEHGVAIFHIPCYYFDKPQSEPIKSEVDPWGHVRYFAAKELARSLAEAGFIILRLGFQFDYGSMLCVVAKSSEVTSGYRGR